MLKSCSRTDIWSCSRKLSSIVYCTAATGRRFHCGMGERDICVVWRHYSLILYKSII